MLEEFNDQIPFYNYLDIIKEYYDNDFEKEFVNKKSKELNKLYGTKKIELPLNLIKQNKLYIFQNSNLELIFLELLKNHLNKVKIVVEINKQEIAYLQGFLSNYSIEKICKILSFGDELQYSRVLDLAKYGHFPQINLVIDLDYSKVVDFFKIINLLYLLGANTSFGFYEDKKKIAI
ncbi:hypothetical protein HOK68_04025, partial [Candidatus Woesearchaeota archaeon]|nr:hypothetical protein [Candidatus Woesearchaeota archaeon]